MIPAQKYHDAQIWSVGSAEYDDEIGLKIYITETGQEFYLDKSSLKAVNKREGKKKKKSQEE